MFLLCQVKVCQAKLINMDLDLVYIKQNLINVINVRHNSEITYG